MKIKRYVIQTKEESKRYTNLSSFDDLKSAMLVKRLIERRREPVKVRIFDRETKTYF